MNDTRRRCRGVIHEVVAVRPAIQGPAAERWNQLSDRFESASGQIHYIARSSTTCRVKQGGMLVSDSFEMRFTIEPVSHAVNL